MELGFETERHPADWKRFGRRAGPIRNEEMAVAGADLAIGFRSEGKSSGTDDAARRFIKHHIPVEMSPFLGEASFRKRPPWNPNGL